MTKKVLWVGVLVLVGLAFWSQKKEQKLPSVPVLEVVASPAFSGAVEHPPSSPSRGEASPGPDEEGGRLPHFFSFMEAARSCSGSEPCPVEGSPLAEYQKLKAKGAESSELLSLINFLMEHLSNPIWRKEALQILRTEFPEGSQLNYWYLGEYYAQVGEKEKAALLFQAWQNDERARLDSEFVRWSVIARFYVSMGDCAQARAALSKGREVGQLSAVDAREQIARCE